MHARGGSTMYALLGPVRTTAMTHPVREGALILIALFLLSMLRSWQVGGMDV